jgi:hypothetical protein
MWGLQGGAQSHEGGGRGGEGRYRILRRLDARRGLSTIARNQPFAQSARCNSIYTGGRDDSVGVATRYWMDVPGIEHRLDETRAERLLGPLSLLHRGYWLFPGGWG